MKKKHYFADVVEGDEREGVVVVGVVVVVVGVADETYEVVGVAAGVILLLF